MENTKNYIGTITGVVDKSRYVIEVNVPDVYEKVKAYPLLFLDEPRPGKEVFLFEFGKDLFVYLPIRTKEDDVKWVHGDNMIKMKDDGLDIISRKKVNVYSKGKVSIANQKVSLLDVLLEMMTTYMSTVTVQGGPLDPSSMKNAKRSVETIKKLLE